MRYITEKEMWYLIKNEDRKTLADLAEHFDCTCEELYQYYSKVIKTETYRNYVGEKVDNLRTKRGLRRGKEIFGVGKVEHSTDKNEKEMPNVYTNFDTGDTYGYRILRSDKDV